MAATAAVAEVTGRDDAHANEHRLLLVPPTQRDGAVTRDLLSRAGIDCRICPDARALAAEIDAGAGAVMLADSALADPAIDEVLAVFARQPAWSDLPMVLLARDGIHSATATRVLALLTNVTLLDRPTSTRSMVSAVGAALRARERQYQLRDYIAALRDAEDALRVEHRRKDEFLATLAHELRNPLAPIRTGLQVLARSADATPGAPQVRAMMERQLAQLIRLIDDLLDLSRISSGKIVLRLASVDLRGIVANALEACQPALDAGGHALDVKLPDAPVMVIGDASRLAQAMANLLTNAAKYTAPGGRVSVVLERDGDFARISVADNGAGIPPDMIDDVFDMFTQIDRTLDRSQGGLGIGLSLVRRLMQMHGGTVDARSDGLQQGSTFTLRLPLQRTMVAAPIEEGCEAGAGDGDRTRV